MCNKCQNVKQNKAHTWSEPIITVAPTSEAEGKEVVCCSECGYIKINTLAKLPFTETPAGGEDDDQSGEQNTEQNGEQNTEQNGEQNTEQNGEQNTEQNGEQNTEQNGEQNTEQNGEQNTKPNSEQNTEQSDITWWIVALVTANVLAIIGIFAITTFKRKKG